MKHPIYLMDNLGESIIERVRQKAAAGTEQFREACIFKQVAMTILCGLEQGEGTGPVYAVSIAQGTGEQLLAREEIPLAHRTDVPHLSHNFLANLFERALNAHNVAPR